VITSVVVCTEGITAKFHDAILLANQLATWSQTSCEPVCDQVWGISTCRDSSTWSQTC